MFRLEFWRGGNYHDQRTYSTFKNFQKYTMEFYKANGHYHTFKVYEIIDGEWKQLKHNNGIIIR